MKNVPHHVVVERDLTRSNAGPFHLHCTSCSFDVIVSTHEYAMASLKEHQLDPSEDWKYLHLFESTVVADEWAERYRHMEEDLRARQPRLHNPYDPGCAQRAFGSEIDPFAHCEICRGPK